MRARLHLGLIALVALAGCAPSFGTTPTAVETKLVNCPVEMVEPDCPDLPPTAGKPREVSKAEWELVYEQCRGWATVVWAGRQECPSTDR